MNLADRCNDMVQIPGIAGRSPREILRQHLSEIIEPRIEGIFAIAQRELLRSGMVDNLGSGVVLVGGPALLEGAQELAERIFNLPVRCGLPINVQMPEELMKPMYTTAAGLLLKTSGSIALWVVRSAYSSYRLRLPFLG